MTGRFDRTVLLIGRESLERFRKSHVAIFGIGGVGGYLVEALARSGVGEFTLVDADCVDVTNLNRQIIATEDTIGRAKTEAMRARILSINPDALVHMRQVFFLPENASQFDFSNFSYVADCVDTVSAKIELVLRANDAGVPIISAMGAGNKLDPSAFRIADLAKTKVCPLARVMRRELKKYGVEHLKVVYSEETPIVPETDGMGDRVPGSFMPCPAIMGLLMANQILKQIGDFED